MKEEEEKDLYRKLRCVTLQVEEKDVMGGFTPVSVSEFKDPVYKKFLEAHYKKLLTPRRGKRLAAGKTNGYWLKKHRTNRYTEKIGVEYYGGTHGIATDYLVNAFDAGIYFQGEEGQFRTPAERKQALELFCYPIGIFNFSLSEKKGIPREAFRFIQSRALLKTAAWMGLDFNDAQLQETLKEYYASEIKNEEIWNDIYKMSLAFYKSCLL